MYLASIRLIITILLFNTSQIVDGYHNKLVSKPLFLKSLRATIPEDSYSLKNKKIKNQVFSPIFDLKITKKKNSRSVKNAETQDVPRIKDILSNAALIGGTTVGAGMLALPTYAGQSGFLPSSLGLIGSWIFVVTTGLLLAEVCSYLSQQKSDENKSVGLLSIMNTTLGDKFTPVAGFLYLLNSYVMLVAYIAEGGDILEEAFQLDPGIEGMLLFTTVFGGLIAFGSESFVEFINNVFVVLILSTFFLLVGTGIPSMHVEGLSSVEFSHLRESIPVFLLALVFHNVVPVTCKRLKYNKEAITKSITIGAGAPLIMFLLWDAVVLGVSNKMDKLDSNNIEQQLIKLFQGSSSLNNFVDVGSLINIFSELVIVTSFIGFVYGLLDFFTDAFKNQNPEKMKIPLFLLTLFPPLVVAAFDPDIFLSCLDVAGTFGTCLLYGAVPPIMAFKMRNQAANEQEINKKKNKKVKTIPYETFVPGGNFGLFLVFSGSFFVVFEKVQSMFPM